jgi:hypothetical protein
MSRSRWYPGKFLGQLFGSPEEIPKSVVLEELKTYVVELGPEYKLELIHAGPTESLLYVIPYYRTVYADIDRITRKMNVAKMLGYDWRKILKHEVRHEKWHDIVIAELFRRGKYPEIKDRELWNILTDYYIDYLSPLSETEEGEEYRSYSRDVSRLKIKRGEMPEPTLLYSVFAIAEDFSSEEIEDLNVPYEVKTWSKGIRKNILLSIKNIEDLEQAHDKLLPIVEEIRKSG